MTVGMSSNEATKTNEAVSFHKVSCDRCGATAWVTRRRPFVCPKCKGRAAHIVNLGREALLAGQQRREGVAP